MARADNYPDFAEFCKKAREMEKRLLSVQQSPISGTLPSPGAPAFFPPEYEDYNYSYMLSEARKVERKLFATSYQAALASPQEQVVSSIDERQMEDELHQFSASPPPRGEEPLHIEAGPAKKKGLKIGDIFGFGKKAQPAKQQAGTLPATAAEPPTPTAIPQPQPVSRRIPPSIPKAAPKAKEEAQTPEEEEVPKPRLEKGTAGLIPEEAPPEEEIGEEPVVPEGERSPAEEEKEEGQEPFAPLPAGEKEQPKASAISSSSRISPRLRAIIEDKLRKEEQKKSAVPDEELEKPAASEEEPSEQEQVVFSSRERLLRRLKSSAPAIPKEAQEEEKIVQRRPAAKEEEPPEETKTPVPEALEETEVPLPEAPGEEEGQMAQKEEEQETPRDLQEEPRSQTRRKAGPSVELPQGAGGLLIKPIFSDETQKEAEEKGKDSHTPAGVVYQERMQRIQRIIDELSPDKYKASVGKREEEQQKEQEEKEGQPSKRLEKKKAAQEEPEVQPSKRLEKKKAAQAEIQEEEQAEGEIPAPIPIPAKKAQQKKAKVKPQALQPSSKRALPEKKALLKKQPAQEQIPAKQKAKTIPKKQPLQEERENEIPAKGKQPAQKQIPAKLLPLKVKPGEGQRAIPKREPIPQDESEDNIELHANAIAGGEGAQAVLRKPLGREATKEREETARPIPRRRQEEEEIEQHARAIAQGEEPRAQEEEERHLKKPLGAIEQAIGPKPRILPGGVALQRTGEPKTYVPPAREKLVPKMQQAEEEQGEPPAQPLRSAMKQMNAALATIKSKPPAPKPQEESEPAEQQEEEVPIPKPEQPAEQEEKPAQKPMQYPPSSPASAQEELSPPRPQAQTAQQGGTLSQQEYEQAKEDFKRKMEQQGVMEKATEETEQVMEQYAKENMTWLYEIYKMGGLAREDFLERVREKIAEDRGGQPQQPQAEAPGNPALAALSKEIDKRYKK